MARNGVSPFPRNFDKIIVAGHSMGSIITQLLSVTYPNDANAIILTGYSKYIINFMPGIFATGTLLPAAAVDPAKYGYLPVGYLEADSFSGIEYLFWYDPYKNGTYYDPAFPAYDYALRQAITVGEGASGAVAATTAYGFTGDVLTITGQQDTLFCGTTALPIDGPGQCVGGPVNYLAGTADLYPNAQYWWWNVPNAGHCWHFHYSAQQGFAVTHDWLADRGF
jgi:pimeloyl-ACP methyl ester carboxylesterase